MKIIKIITGSLVIAALAGCAASVDQIQTGDGRNGYSISCNGSADSWTKCYRAATQACPAGYDVVDRDSSSTPTAYGPMVTRSMTIACKA
ncbi:hypothetical protein BG60_26565 [Caballeronia zhejiangensis]|uniref:Lipoprotein n=2 Tax=Caballeronia zhejiangensis TaxID=871203 RepID=A0A656QC45_9BURK|nr:hypothetical protein BG60_26565 [Caballeronia zhejiangensis]